MNGYGLQAENERALCSMMKVSKSIVHLRFFKYRPWIPGVSKPENRPTGVTIARLSNIRVHPRQDQITPRSVWIIFICIFFILKLFYKKKHVNCLSRVSRFSTYETRDVNRFVKATSPEMATVLLWSMFIKKSSKIFSLPSLQHFFSSSDGSSR